MDLETDEIKKHEIGIKAGNNTYPENKYACRFTNRSEGIVKLILDDHAYAFFLISPIPSVTKVKISTAKPA